MRISKKYINHNEYDVLEVTILDRDDVDEIEKEYTNFSHIEIDLSSLQYLSKFSRVETLILTGGVPTIDGLNTLYQHNAIKTLVLDYEETDSDEEGIDITRFPNLQYVLSRSNLNIRKYSSDCRSRAKIDILNFYGGNKSRVQYPSNYDIYKQDKFLFFSVEAKTPASSAIMHILSPVENYINMQHKINKFSKNLCSIAIIPICVPESMIEQGFGCERRIVSIVKKTADIRLRIPYETFVSGTEEFRRIQCRNTILEAALYIQKKDKTFLLCEFMSAIENALNF